MNRKLSAATLAAALLGLFEPTAEAQVTAATGGPPLRGADRRPVTSPYLNLLGGNGVGFNYYRRVRPELELRREDARLGQSVRGLKRRAAQPSGASPQTQPQSVGPTGHPAAFLNLGTYFRGVSPGDRQ